MRTTDSSVALQAPGAAEPASGSLARATVDVGIPTLGNSPYIAESIESVFAQSLTSWTLTISENGPGLESMRRTLEPYLRDERVRHVITGEKVGRGTNHNLLIRQGSAPYVGVLHDDDRWHPHFLERRVSLLEEHPGCGLVFSGYSVIDENGKPVGRTKPVLPPGVHSSSAVLPQLYRDNFIGCPTVLVRRTAYEAVGSHYEDILNYDIPMWLRLVATFELGSLAGWDADYRHHSGQASANRLHLAEEQLPVLDAVADLPLAPSLRRVVLAETHVRCALDAIERREQRRSLEHIGHALRADPTSLVRPTIAARMAVAIAAIAAGARGRRALANARERRWHTGGLELLPSTRVASHQQPDQSGDSCNARSMP